MDIERSIYVRKPRLRQGPPKPIPVWLIVGAALVLGVAVMVAPLAYVVHHMATAPTADRATTALPTELPFTAPSPASIPGKVYCGWGFSDTFNGQKLPEDYAPATGIAEFRLTTNVGLIVVSIDRTQYACAAESTRSLVVTGYYDNVTCAPIGQPAVAVGCGKQDPGYSYGADGSDPLVHFEYNDPSSSPDDIDFYDCKDMKPNGQLRGSLCHADGRPMYPIQPTRTHRGVVSLISDADGAAGGRMALEYATGTLKDANYPAIGQIVAGQDLLDQAVRSGVRLKIISASLA
jgi:cyclophilin family peptidyl-prolyl cis-trans isomerase